MEPHKRNRNPKYKARYQGVNWAKYEKNLRNRGNICLWISDEVIKKWSSTSKKKRGGQQIYSDLAIEIMLSIRLWLCRFDLSIYETCIANSRSYNSIEKNGHTGYLHQKQTSIRKTDALDSG